MKSQFLVKNQHPDCLVFYAGWGMDAQPFREILPKNYDFLLLYDYRELEFFDFSNLKKRYKNLHLLAWSLGVWCSATTISQDQSKLFTSSTAVNGTLNPINQDFGIKEKDYLTLIEHFSADSLLEFYQNMFTVAGDMEQFLANRPKRSQKSLLDELHVIQKQYQLRGPAADIFRQKIVGSMDRIFPARSQLRSWGRNNCQTLKIPHFPFYEWNGWNHPEQTDCII